MDRDVLEVRMPESGCMDRDIFEARMPGGLKGDPDTVTMGRD